MVISKTEIINLIFYFKNLFLALNKEREKYENSLKVIEIKELNKWNMIWNEWYILVANNIKYL